MGYHDDQAQQAGQRANQLGMSDPGSIAHWDAMRDQQNHAQQAQWARNEEARAGGTIVQPGVGAGMGVGAGAGGWVGGGLRPAGDGKGWKVLGQTLALALGLPLAALLLWWLAVQGESAWAHSGPGRGLAAGARAAVFGDLAPTPADALRPGGVAATPLPQAELVRQLRATVDPAQLYPQASPLVRRAESPAGQWQAYRCMLDPGCRQAVQMLAGEYAAGQLPRQASALLWGQLKAGRTTAATDLCLLRLVPGATPADLIAADKACQAASMALPTGAPLRAQALALASGWRRSLAALLAAGS